MVLFLFQEKRGRHFLAPDRPKRRSPSKSPIRDSSPETEEAKTLKKLKDIQDLVVKDEEKYVAEPLNPDMFEWDEKWVDPFVHPSIGSLKYHSDIVIWKSI